MYSHSTVPVPPEQAQPDPLPPDPPLDASSAIHRSLCALLLDAERDPRAPAELARARREFFGPQEAAQAEAPARPEGPAELRFAEWFLLERDSELLGEPWGRSLGRAAEVEERHGALAESICGVFLVVQRSPGEQRARLRDLQNAEGVDLDVPASMPLEAGDLLVGRLYGEAAAARVPSPAIAVQRGGAVLGRALQSDLEGLALERRLTQAELEHVLFRRWDALRDTAAAPPLERLEAELATRLAHAGQDEVDVAALSAALAQTTQPGRVMGPLLDQLAFDSDVDLLTVQRLLLEIWNAHRDRQGEIPQRAPLAEDALQMDAAGGTMAPAAEPDTDSDDAPGLGARLAQRIEEGLTRSENVEDLFDDVAAMLGTSLEDDDDDGEDAAAFDGDLEPLVVEYLWEEDRAGTPSEAVLRALVAQQREAPVPRLDLEAVEARDLLRLLVRVYLETAPSERAAVVQDNWRAIEHFYRWAARTQEYELDEVLATCRAAFVDEVERVQRASLELERGAVAAPDTPPGLLRVVAVDEERAELASSSGAPAVWVPVEAGGALTPGDLVLAGVRTADAIEEPVPGQLVGMVVVLPAETESLLGQ